MIKKDGERQAFDYDKLARSIQVSLRKRPVSKEKIDMMIHGIVRKLEMIGEAEITVDAIGEAVMKALSKLDKVAYVRFASVYKDFDEVKDFGDFVKKL